MFKGPRLVYTTHREIQVQEQVLREIQVQEQVLQEIQVQEQVVQEIQVQEQVVQEIQVQEQVLREIQVQEQVLVHLYRVDEAAARTAWQAETMPSEPMILRSSSAQHWATASLMLLLLHSTCIDWCLVTVQPTLLNHLNK